MPSSSSVVIVSKCTVYPAHKSTLNSLKLSVSDLPMLSCYYIQKGVLLSKPTLPIPSLISRLKLALSKALAHFPALAGSFSTDPEVGHVRILCNDSGVDFIHAKAPTHSIHTLLAPLEVPYYFKLFFAFDDTLSYAGHHLPLTAVQVTELKDGLFVGCTINHAVVDGTSFWNFFNTFAEFAKGTKEISKSPDFSRDTVFDSPAILPLPAGGPAATFSGDEPLRERIFHFSREAISKLKFKANSQLERKPEVSGLPDSKIFGKRSNDYYRDNGGINGNIITSLQRGKPTVEMSSFQSLCALLWRAVTRARKLGSKRTTTFRMAVNCRHRLEPRMHPLYFGNAIQSIPTVASVGDLLSSDLRWGANLLHQNVVKHDDGTVRLGVKDWESSPRLFPLGNFDGAMVTMGSSPRFPMYDNDFGWGRPLAVRSGKANKFDGKISAFPGRDGNGSVDLEVVLAPQTMAGLEVDSEFMQFAT